MPVFRWGSPIEAFRDLEREVDRLLQSMNATFEGLRIGRPYPAINVYELDEEFLLTAELPGTRVEDLELSVGGRVLTMRGVRQDADEIDPDRFRRSERPRGEWERSLPLPDRVEEEKMYAELIHGVLKLHLPKAPSERPRHIPVTDASTGDGSTAIPTSSPANSAEPSDEQ